MSEIPLYLALLEREREREKESKKEREKERERARLRRTYTAAMDPFPQWLLGAYLHSPPTQVFSERVNT